MPSERLLPSQAPPGFSVRTGIPNTSNTKPYFAETKEAIERCVGDPRCVGVSAQRMFYGPVGTPATIGGRKGEETCFMRN